MVRFRRVSSAAAFALLGGMLPLGVATPAYADEPDEVFSQPGSVSWMVPEDADEITISLWGGGAGGSGGGGGGGGGGGAGSQHAALLDVDPAGGGGGGGGGGASGSGGGQGTWITCAMSSTAVKALRGKPLTVTVGRGGKGGAGGKGGSGGEGGEYGNSFRSPVADPGTQGSSSEPGGNGEASTIRSESNDYQFQVAYGGRAYDDTATSDVSYPVASGAVAGAGGHTGGPGSGGVPGTGGRGSDVVGRVAQRPGLPVLGYLCDDDTLDGVTGENPVAGRSGSDGGSRPLPYGGDRGEGAAAAAGRAATTRQGHAFGAGGTGGAGGAGGIGGQGNTNSKDDTRGQTGLPGADGQPGGDGADGGVLIWWE